MLSSGCLQGSVDGGVWCRRNVASTSRRVCPTTNSRVNASDALLRLSCRRVDASTRQRVDASTRRRINALTRSTRGHVDASTRQRVNASARRRVERRHVDALKRPRVDASTHPRVNVSCRRVDASTCRHWDPPAVGPLLRGGDEHTGYSSTAVDNGDEFKFHIEFDFSLDVEVTVERVLWSQI